MAFETAKEMRFEFATATRIIFGAGALREIGPLATEMGAKALVVTGGTTARAARLLDLLAEQEIGTVTFAVAAEPTTEVARLGRERAREAGCDLVVGLGGGSILDTGKAIAATSRFRRRLAPAPR
jgi:alcohol dehydrogenase class IV